MKFRNAKTGETIEATPHDGEYAEWRAPDGTLMGLDPGDVVIRRASGEYEKAQPSHPFWSNFVEVVETRVVKIEDDAGTRYAPERLTGTGWVRGPEVATQKAAEAAVVTAPKLTVVKAFEGGEAKAELVAGDDPSTPEVETSWWRKVLAIVGIATDAP